MDAVKQNRITRKKLRKAIKRQAQKRMDEKAKNDNLRDKLIQISAINTDCEMLLHLAINDVLDCVNSGKFSSSVYVDFDLGFMKMGYSGGRFFLRSVRLPNKDDFNEKGA